jgi:hypothetical protein
LRLQWLQLAMERALAIHDAARAASLYSEAGTWLRAGDSIRAEALHALGSAARMAVGDAAGARAAQARADDARSTLRASIPEAMRTGFDAATVIPQVAPARVSQ